MLQTISHPVGVKRGVNSRLSRNTVPYFTYKSKGRAVPYAGFCSIPPSISGVETEGAPSLPQAPRGSRAYHVRISGRIWLARTGGLPGRSLAGYRRWALTPPFHPSPVPYTDATCRVCTGHRLVCSLLHLTWRRAYAAPPLGLLARAAFWTRVETHHGASLPRVLASPDFALRPRRNPRTQRRVGRPRPSSDYTSRC